MIFLQTASDLKEIVAINDATIVGTLMIVSIALGATVIYLYKNVQSLNKDFISELKANNETLLKVNNSYNEFTHNMLELMNKK
jgi:uncharacterized protein YoxC